MGNANSYITLVVIAHIALYVVILYGTLWLMGDRLKKENLFKIDENGRRMIFVGVPAIGYAALMCTGEIIAHAVGEKAYPYVFFGLMVAFGAAGMVLYNFIPEKWTILLGVAGWITTFSWTYW